MIDGEATAEVPRAPGLKVIAFVFVLLGASVLPRGLAALADGAAPILLRIFGLPFAASLIVAGVGLWGARAWSRPLAMGAAAVVVVAILVTILLAPPGPLTFIAVLFLAAMLSTLFYLQRPHVRAALR